MKAYYDPKTDKIHNAVEGTRTYLHELRHKQQNNSKGWRAANYASSISAISGAGLNLIVFINYLFVGTFSVELWGIATFLLSLLFVYRIVEEFDAHIYSVVKHESN